jgi:HAD superfamily hydrolase (TIGR01549 family)
MNPKRENNGRKLWLFDFDNTLAALEPEVDWAASRRELESYLRSVGVDDSIFMEFPKGNLVLYEALRGRLMKAAAEKSRANGLGESEPEKLLIRASEIIESYELRGVDDAEPTEGAHELLKIVAQDHGRMAIVTSNSSRTVRRWLDRRRITETIRTIVGRDSLLPLKPAPQMIHRAIDLCDANLAEAVFIGDSEADLGAARDARVRFYGVARSAAKRSQLATAGAESSFSSLSELMVYLGLSPTSQMP